MSSNFWGKPPIAIAHRGGDAAGEDQENTLAAFISAQKLGYEYGETDVILTADGRVAAIHGSRNWLQAYFSGRMPRQALQKLTLKEIRSHTGEGIRVTTLEEILTKLPQMKFFIDPKTGKSASGWGHPECPGKTKEIGLELPAQYPIRRR